MFSLKNTKTKNHVRHLVKHPQTKKIGFSDTDDLQNGLKIIKNIVYMDQLQVGIMKLV